MPRKSRGLDKKLLRVGATLLKTKGVSGLSIREVAKRAGVNLGMFTYYFDGKDAFIKAVMEEAYAPFLQELLASQNQPDTLEPVLFRMAVFSRDHSLEILSILRDVLSGDKNILNFLAHNFTDHFKILNESLARHFRTKGYDPNYLDHAFRYLISTIGLTNLLVNLQFKLDPKTKRTYDSDECLRRRVRAAIEGLETLCRAEPR